jgi:hypothetical protein
MPADQLEIKIDRREIDAYRVEMRFSSPQYETDALAVGRPVRFDFTGLRGLRAAAADYGRLLSANLYDCAPVRDAFIQARATAREHGQKLQVRLFVESSSPELHELRWESLRDPQTDEPIVTREDVLFSRYLASPDWQPVKVRPRGELKALAVIANPSDLGGQRPGGRALAPIDVAGELARIEANLQGIPVTPLAGAGTATLENLRARLREEFDILYLVCHGALIEGRPHLWLEKESGTTHVVGGADLVQQLSEVGQPPRLVVLASCQGAGSGQEPASDDEGMMAALGPCLAEHGFPAVLAMQGNVTMTTAGDFCKVFFRELSRDGQIDRAMAAGRAAVRDRPDHWAPTLFLRLKGGCVWYVPGFLETRPGFDQWQVLVDYIGEGKCTPILGAGLLEAFVGDPRDIARRWAEVHHFPMAPYTREDLPQVAQFLEVTAGGRFPELALKRVVCEELRHRFGLEALRAQASPDDCFAAAARASPQALEPFRILADLPLPMYLTTTPDTLLVNALRAAGREPRLEYARWNSAGRWPTPLDQSDPDYEPSAEHPLVYQLFGSFGLAKSVVVSEDDYFDYLLSVTRKDRGHPAAVNRRLVDSALMFLGFRLDDWSFRVLYRSLMALEGKDTLEDYFHVAVQISPDENRTIEPNRARRYLERFLARAPVTTLSIYWGSSEEFLRDLGARWNQAAGGEVPADRRPPPVPGSGTR